MSFKVSGALATALTLAMTSAVAAQSNITYYQQLPSGYQTGTIAPAATSTYQAPITANTYQAPAQVNTYQAPTTTQQTVGQTIYAAPSITYSTQQPALAAPQPAISAPQSVTTYSNTTPSYASPYKPTAQTGAPAPTQTYVQTPGPTYQQPNFAAAPQPQPHTIPQPAKIATRSVPDSTAPSAGGELQDTDAWAFNLARFYPAVQACLRKSSVKNPVIANIQVQGDKTKMLIGEGGSSSFSTCATGLTGTVVKAKSNIQSLPSAFFAPLGSTFTVSPDRPFQPIVDTDQKVIGWLVRTQPTRAVNQFGQAVGFDGQFIPPVMVNTNVGKS